MSGKSHPGNQPTLPREREYPPPVPTETAWTVWCLRGVHRLSQAELAARSGVSESAISRYENGKKVPGPKTWAKLSAAVGLSVATVDEVLRPAIRKVLVILGGASPGLTGNSAQAEDWVDELQRVLAAIQRPMLTLVVEEVLAAAGPWERDRPPSPADRLEAPGLWAVLRASSAAERVLLLQEAHEYWSWAVCELACAESVTAASHSAERALELAELAVEIAQRVLGSDLWCRRLLGFAGAHLGNAWRAHGKPQASEEAFLQALPHWKAGAAASPGLLNEARVLGLEASLRIDQRQATRALGLITEALEVDRHGEKKYLMVNRARALELLGDYEGAITALQAAEPLVDGSLEPRLLCVIRFNLLGNLLHLGHLAEAEALLPRVQALSGRLGQALDLVRTRWLAGWLAAGLGNRKEAVAVLEQVRQDFNTREMPYDAALATLELATLYLEEGRTGEVRILASELKWIFKAEGIEREALAALRLFYEAAEQEAFTVELARRMASFLYRAQHDPELRFEVPDSAQDTSSIVGRPHHR
jgi:transcriptional regulator with XRE-family HTH domain/tetratricopeptide (TPR) repeat protein